MSLRERLRRRTGPPTPADLKLLGGERVLATAALEDGVLVVTSQRLLAPGALAQGKPWHLVDAGGWDGEGTLAVSWVDGTPASTWALAEPGRVPEAFHDRVQTSIVIAEPVTLDRRRRARVVLRRDLATDALLSQTIVARGCDPDDPELVAATEAVARGLAEQVGLAP